MARRYNRTSRRSKNAKNNMTGHNSNTPSRPRWLTMTDKRYNPQGGGPGGGSNTPLRPRWGLLKTDKRYKPLGGGDDGGTHIPHWLIHPHRGQFKYQMRLPTYQGGGTTGGRKRFHYELTILIRYSPYPLFLNGSASSRSF